MLKLRVHIDCVHPDKLLTFLQTVANRCEKFIVYRHPKEEAEREHIHALLYNTILIPKTLRDWCCNKLELQKGNENYSVGETYKVGKQQVKMTELNYVRYIAYMSKGKYDPMYNKGFSETEIDAIRDSYRPETTNVDTNKSGETIEKRNKLTQYQIGREAINRYLIQYGEIEVDYRLMGYIIINLLHENHSLAHYTIVSNIIQDIQAELQEDRFMDAVMARIKI